MTKFNYDDLLYDNFGSTKEAVKKVRDAKSDLHLRQVIEYTFILPKLLEKFDFENFGCSLILTGIAGKYGGLKVFDIKFIIKNDDIKDAFSEYYQTKGNIVDKLYEVNSLVTTHLEIQFLGLLPKDPFNVESFEIEIPLSSNKNDYIDSIHKKLLNKEQLVKLAKILLDYELSSKASSDSNLKSKI